MFPQLLSPSPSSLMRNEMAVKCREPTISITQSAQESLFARTDNINGDSERKKVKWRTENIAK